MPLPPSKVCVGGGGCVCGSDTKSRPAGDFENMNKK